MNYIIIENNNQLKEILKNNISNVFNINESRGNKNDNRRESKIKRRKPKIKKRR
jgi:hypothetical protein